MASTAQQRTLDVADLFAMADALQIELTVSNGDQIDGKVAETINATTLGVSFPLELEVASSRVSWGDKGSIAQMLVLRGTGNLMVIAVNDKVNSMIHVGLYDVSKTGVTKLQLEGYCETRPSQKIGQLIKTFEKGLALAVHRGAYDRDWKDGSAIIASPPAANAAP